VKRKGRGERITKKEKEKKKILGRFGRKCSTERLHESIISVVLTFTFDSSSPGIPRRAFIEATPGGFYQQRAICRRRLIRSLRRRRTDGGDPSSSAPT